MANYRNDDCDNVQTLVVNPMNWNCGFITVQDDIFLHDGTVAISFTVPGTHTYYDTYDESTRQVQNHIMVILLV